MTSKAIVTKGTKLQRGDAQPTEAFTTIGEVTGFKGPNGKVSSIDVTSFDSEAMEYKPGLADFGELSFDFNFVPGDVQQQGARADLALGTIRNHKLIFKDHPTNPTTIAFVGFLTTMDLTGSTNQVVKGSGALKITGLPVITYAPSV